MEKTYLDDVAEKRKREKLKQLLRSKIQLKKYFKNDVKKINTKLKHLFIRLGNLKSNKYKNQVTKLELKINRIKNKKGKIPPAFYCRSINECIIKINGAKVQISGSPKRIGIVKAEINEYEKQIRVLEKRYETKLSILKLEIKKVKQK